MSSAIIPIASTQKEIKSGTSNSVRIEKFDGGIEVVYPQGWGTSPSVVPTPSSLINPQAIQTPEERSLAQQRAIIKSFSSTQDPSTTIEKMEEALYIIPPKAA